MTAKIKTNEQAFKALFKDLDTHEVALLRERVLTIMQKTKEAIEANPEAWKNGFIHPELYLKLNEKVEKHIGFDV